MIMIRDFSNMFQQMSGMPINSKGGKAMLKKYGIDTNSGLIRMGIASMLLVWPAWMQQGFHSRRGTKSSVFPKSQGRICLTRQRGIFCRKTAWETEIQQDAQRFSRDIS